MSTHTPQDFEALIRRELAQRDGRRRARIGDRLAYEAADTALVAAVMEAAGFAAPADGEKVQRKARRARRDNEDEAFGEADG
jgi:hypothetical protein